MHQVTRSMVLCLSLVAPVWAQAVFPSDNSTITQMRPNIGCDWGGGVRNLQLFIDGKDWTNACNKNGGRIDINPVFDVGYGRHVVESRAVNLVGLRLKKTWTFTIANNNNSSPARVEMVRTYPVVNASITEVRPRISADFSQNVRSAQVFLDGQNLSSWVGVNGSNVAVTPQHDLAVGNHQVRFEVAAVNGAQFVHNWNFLVSSSPANVTNGFINLVPANNSQTSSLRPVLSADFAVVMDQIRMWLDQQDVTNHVQISSNRLTWNPGYDLALGKHSVRVEGRQTSNQQAVLAEWQFDIIANNHGSRDHGGAWNQGDINFSVDSPNAGERVSNVFRVRGNASAGSSVRVTVKPLPYKNKVAQFSGQRDREGNYNIVVNPVWATKGMRLEVTTSVLDARGRVLTDPIVVKVTRH